MARQTEVTIDHDVIRRWAEQRGARPARVKGTGGRGDVGVIRLDFPDYSGKDTLEPISWEKFFEKFDAQNLALVFQERTASGAPSNFSKLVKRDSPLFRERAGRSIIPVGRLETSPARPRKRTARAQPRPRPRASSTRATRKPARRAASR